MHIAQSIARALTVVESLCIIYIVVASRVCPIYTPNSPTPPTSNALRDNYISRRVCTEYASLAQNYTHTHIKTQICMRTHIIPGILAKGSAISYTIHMRNWCARWTLRAATNLLWCWCSLGACLPAACLAVGKYVHNLANVLLKSLFKPTANGIECVCSTDADVPPCSLLVVVILVVVVKQIAYRPIYMCVWISRSGNSI